MSSEDDDVGGWRGKRIVHTRTKKRHYSITTSTGWWGCGIVRGGYYGFSSGHWLSNIHGWFYTIHRASIWPLHKKVQNFLSSMLGKMAVFLSCEERISFERLSVWRCLNLYWSSVWACVRCYLQIPLNGKALFFKSLTSLVTLKWLSHQLIWWRQNVKV